MTLEGPLAAALRRAAYLYRQPTAEQRLNVITEWATQLPNIANAVLSAMPGAGAAASKPGTGSGSSSS